MDTDLPLGPPYSDPHGLASALPFMEPVIAATGR